MDYVKKAAESGPVAAPFCHPAATGIAGSGPKSLIDITKSLSPQSDSAAQRGLNVCGLMS
jgi:hypothetical protein